jgi:N-acetyl sugar amidotransferase
MIKYQICNRCVMDTSDGAIKFDEHGICNHCHYFDDVQSKQWHPNDAGRDYLIKLFNKIKKDGEGSEYDCILGLSGGVDSSYLALKLAEFKLRPLVVHVDAGWNSELAVSNIEKIVKYCNYDLHTHVMNWDEMRDLQLSYLKAAVANQDVPQDHAFFANLYHFSVKHKIKYIISGGNIATESVVPSSWHHSAMDAINLKSIHNKFGKLKLSEYKTISFIQYYFYYPFLKGMRTVRPLNFMPYNKDEALNYLSEKIGYRKYPRKHGESIFTKFFQNYYLPTKFGMDKRRPHFSSLILSNQMTRAEALIMLEESLYEKSELERDIFYICKKLRITNDEFFDMMKIPINSATKFRNWNWLQRLAKNIQYVLQKILRKKINIYS